MVIPVTERSEDTGLVYPSVCGEGAERSKFIMKDYFSFEEQSAIAKKSNIGNFMSKNKKNCQDK